MFLRRLLTVAAVLTLTGGVVFAQEKAPKAGDFIVLPKPKYEGKMSVEEAIYKRRSVRNFSALPLKLEEVSQLLWAAGGATADGVTGATRAYPSAGAIYPLEIYLVAGQVEGLDPGVYKYDWIKHSLTLLKEGDVREALSKAAMSQEMVKDAPITIAVTAMLEKIASRYGERGATRYASMDTGHLGENVHLEAASLGLGTVMVGAFMDKELVNVLGVKDQVPLYLMPVGRPASKNL